MNITEARIDHLSDLARLSLPGGEKEEIARELERILDYMAVVDGLGSAGGETVSPVFPLINSLTENVIFPPSTGFPSILVISTRKVTFPVSSS